MMARVADNLPFAPSSSRPCCGRSRRGCRYLPGHVPCRPVGLQRRQAGLSGLDRVLLVDALAYSATDIFAAGFEDHEIGLIIGTASGTGAGGANVWG